MGKIFLVLIVVAGCWGVYSVYSSWNKRSAKFSPPAPVVEQNLAPVDPVQLVDEKEDTDDDDSDCDYLAVVAQTAQWIWVQEWGKVHVGDLLPDGSKLSSWYAVGSDWFAKTVSGARVRVIRFGRYAEMLAANLEKYPIPQLPVAAPVTAAVPGSLEASAPVDK